MTEPSEPITLRSVPDAARADRVVSIDATSVSLHDLLVAATDDDLESALERFIVVARSQIGAAVGVVLHPSLGGLTFVSEDAPLDLLSAAAHRDQTRATIMPIDSVANRLFGWLVINETALDDEPALISERLARLLAGALTRLTSGGPALGVHRRDPLTGLANRRALEAAIWAAAQARSLPWTQITAVVDDMITIRDTINPDAADDVMVALADRLRGLVRDGDLAARVGEDSFVVLVNADAPECAPLAIRIGEALSGGVATSAGTLSTTVTVESTTATTTEAVLKLAPG